jgi:hypothetical protein
MVAQSLPSASTDADSDESSSSRSETIQYLTRLFTILCFASIYVLIRARRKRSLTVASGRDGGEVNFSPAEIGATVSLAASIAWLFIILPILGGIRLFGPGDEGSSPDTEPFFSFFFLSFVWTLEQKKRRSFIVLWNENVSLMREKKKKKE